MTRPVRHPRGRLSRPEYRCPLLRPVPPARPGPCPGQGSAVPRRSISNWVAGCGLSWIDGRPLKQTSTTSAPSAERIQSRHRSWDRTAERPQHGGGSRTLTYTVPTTSRHSNASLPATAQAPTSVITSSRERGPGVRSPANDAWPPDWSGTRSTCGGRARLVLQSVAVVRAVREW
jgi:hypothetical protein